MFRFTIRELVLLTIIAGMAIAWWLDHSQLKRELQILAFIEEVATVEWGAEYVSIARERAEYLQRLGQLAD